MRVNLFEAAHRFGSRRMPLPNRRGRRPTFLLRRACSYRGKAILSDTHVAMLSAAENPRGRKQVACKKGAGRGGALRALIGVGAIFTRGSVVLRGAALICMTMLAGPARAESHSEPWEQQGFASLKACRNAVTADGNNVCINQDIILFKCASPRFLNNPEECFHKINNFCSVLKMYVAASKTDRGDEYKADVSAAYRHYCEPRRETAKCHR